jgi:hypothetical protein
MIFARFKLADGRTLFYRAAPLVEIKPLDDPAVVIPAIGGRK